MPILGFRFPKYGDYAVKGIELELRHALEPWHVMGEESGGGGTVRYVDSSVERMQVTVTGLANDRYVLTCNGQAVPLRPTGNVGELLVACVIGHGNRHHVYIQPLVFTHH